MRAAAATLLNRTTCLREWLTFVGARRSETSTEAWYGAYEGTTRGVREFRGVGVRGVRAGGGEFGVLLFSRAVTVAIWCTRFRDFYNDSSKTFWF